MTWINLGLIKAQKEWQLSQPFSGNLIRIEQNITTLQIGKIPSTKLGLIGLLIEGKFFSIQQFFSDPKEQILYFNYLGFNNLQIAIRDISRFVSGDSWNVNCYYWNSLVNTSNNQQITQEINNQLATTETNIIQAIQNSNTTVNQSINNLIPLI